MYIQIIKFDSWVPYAETIEEKEKLKGCLHYSGIHVAGLT